LRVARARNGDFEAREKLIRDYTPFILKTAASAIKRYVVMSRDDEASIALSAFNEAIDAYSSSRPGFLKFAATVIRRRLIDYFRKQTRHREIPFSALEAQKNGDENNACSLTCDDYDVQDWQKVIERRDEIEKWKETIKEFGINFAGIVKSTPKHEDARKRALYFAHVVARHPDLRKKFFGSKKLPIEEILEKVPEAVRVSKKTLTRQRTYITAMAIILAGDFPSLKEFLGTSSERGYGN